MARLSPTWSKTLKTLILSDNADIRRYQIAGVSLRKDPHSKVLWTLITFLFHMTCKKNVKDKLKQSFEHMNVFYDKKIVESREILLLMESVMIAVFVMSLVVRKPVFGVSDQVPHKLGCTTT